MSETDVRVTLIVSAELLLSVDALLRQLVIFDRADVNRPAGIARDERGSHCLYCSWLSLFYGAKPKHDTTCPILQGQMLLQSEGYSPTGM